MKEDFEVREGFDYKWLPDIEDEDESLLAKTLAQGFRLVLDDDNSPVTAEIWGRTYILTDRPSCYRRYERNRER